MIDRLTRNVHMINKMTIEQRTQTMMMLRANKWIYAISVDARDPTLGGLWLSIIEAMGKLTEKEPEFRYWLAASIGGLTEKPHYHGVIYTALPQTVIYKAFKQSNEPTLKVLYEKDRWYDYAVKQALQGTTITNL